MYLIVREGGEDEIHATVTVVVAGIRAHARLCSGITVHANACGLPDFLEASVPEVVVEEVGIRIVGDEHIDQAVIVVVGRDDAQAIRAGTVGETVRVGRFDELPVADVLEEQVGFARQAGGPDHDVRAVAPDEGALRSLQRVRRRLYIARDVEIEIAVAVGVEKRAAAAPAASRETRPFRGVLERAVTAVAEQDVRPPVRHIEIEPAIAVHIAHTRAASPGCHVDAGLLRDILELPAAQIAIEHVPMRYSRASRGQLGRRDEIDVEQSVAVVVEQRDAAAGGLEDVILCRTAAEAPRVQTCPLFEGHRHGPAIVRGGHRRGCRPHGRCVAAGHGFLRLRLAIAALERQPWPDVSGDVRPHALEQHENGLDGRL